MKNSGIKEILALTIKLFLICVIVAGLLGYINSVTEPIINDNELKEFNLARKEVLPNANNFMEIKMTEFTPSESGVELESIYKGVNGDEICGYVVSTVCHEGYGGDIKVMVGINNDMTVAQIKLMSLNETAGLGAKASAPEFFNQYNGLKKGIGVEKNNGGSAQNNTISAISGATVTSKAVTKAVNCAIEAAEVGGGQNE